MEIDDRILIKKLKSNDQYKVDEAFEALYQKYSKLVYVCIKKYIKNNADIEDILSDTFLKIFEHRFDLKETKNFKYYIVTTANNLSINFVKKKNNNYDLIDIDVVDEYEYDNSEIKDMVDKLHEYLNQEEIDIVIMHLIYALTFEEIAKKTNDSPNTIKTKYYRVLKKVKA